MSPDLSPDVGPPDGVPEAWYNVLADLGIELPPTRAAARRPDGPVAIRPNLPKALVRQSMPLRPFVPIPPPVLAAYRQWRPTPLRRAYALEKAIGTRARIYYKDESGNVAGSHKYLTALAQAHYYAEAGVRALVTSTAAGQWGTAIAAAAHRFRLRCRIYMVPGSYDRKPGRRTVMELLGAEVVRAAAPPGRAASLREAMTEAVAQARGSADARWLLGGSEPYAILHSTVIGLEARAQLAALGEVEPPTLIGYLGGGKNLGGLALPFLRDGHRSPVRAVQSAAYPVLSHGSYGYDSTDDTGLSPMAATYTLGEGFTPPPLRAEGMRYRAAPPLISELFRRGLVTPVAYGEDEVLRSAQRFLAAEGVLVSAEAAYAVHDACVVARGGAHDHRPIVFCLSDHGYYDTDAYRGFLAAGSGTPAPPGPTSNGSRTLEVEHDAG